MWLTNKLTTETGGIGFLPTSIGYKRKIQKQTEMMIEQQKRWKAQQAKIADGKRRLAALKADLWWSELTSMEKKQAETICVTIGYDEAAQFVKIQGMANHRGITKRLNY